MNDEQLLARADRGELEAAAVEAIANELAITSDADRAIFLMELLGRAGATHKRDLVEEFLRATHDPLLVRSALHVLSAHWDMTSAFAREIEGFVRGRDWDDWDDVRLVAINAAGEHLRQQRDPGLLTALMDVFDDIERSATVRNAAYGALARALGRELQPTTAIDFDLEREEDCEVRVLAENRLRQEEAGDSPLPEL